MEGLRQRGPRWARQGLDETGALPEEPGPLQVCLLSGISPALDTHAPCPPSPSTAWSAPACRERSHGGLGTPCLSCCRCSGRAAGPHWSPGDPSPRLHSCSLRVSQGLPQDGEPTSAGSWALSHGSERETDPPPGDRASTRDPASGRGGATVPRRTPRARGWGWRTEGQRLRPHPRLGGPRPWVRGQDQAQWQQRGSARLPSAWAGSVHSPGPSSLQARRPGGGAGAGGGRAGWGQGKPLRKRRSGNGARLCGAWRFQGAGGAPSAGGGDGSARQTPSRSGPAATVTALSALSAETLTLTGATQACEGPGPCRAPPAPLPGPGPRPGQPVPTRPSRVEAPVPRAQV